ncbi:MAG: DUF805 domain-containing protein [Pseudomonadaceae bacterium]|nr:MAG: DUF805 domain-containing protein [Pseudomonadaceae bacterium]
MEHFLDPIKNHYADFTGRATRTQYWMFVLFYVLIYIAVSVVDAFITGGILTLIFALGMLVPCIAIAARRLHDTGRTGWWQLIALIPIIGTIVLIVFLVLDSEGDNQYGPNPKGAPAAV